MFGQCTAATPYRFNSVLPFVRLWIVYYNVVQRTIAFFAWGLHVGWDKPALLQP